MEASVQERNYTRSILSSFDRERHILMDEAYNLVSSQNDSYLSVDKLNSAINNDQIHLYEFKGDKYLDRLDIGRVYHSPVKEISGIGIEKYFTSELNGTEQIIDSAGPYEAKHLEIKDKEGIKTIFEMNAIFPESWDETAATMIAQKYFFKPNKLEWREKLRNKIGSESENSLHQLSLRVSNFFADKGESLGYFSTPEDKQNFRDELLWLQLNKKGAFNSPVQFNAGIYNEYGVEGTKGLNYITDRNTGEVKKFDGGEYVNPQCHACFIKGPRDDLESIANHLVDETGIFAAGSGIGQDIGALRAEGEPLSGGGKASGPMSFFKTYDCNAGSIKSGGKSRRAARMTTIRVDHSDVIEFINSKVKEDKKALTLMEAGYTPGMDGEAYTTVAFQNTNISVRLDDNFFNRLKDGGEIELKRVTDGKVTGKVSAEKIAKLISYGSWRIGDPGVQYESMIQLMHTCKNSGRQNSTNPCSEYDFLNDTSCNLASLNLLEFSDKNGNFDVVSYMKAVRIFSIAQDIANDAASYPVRDIAEISPEFRTIGIGYANLGALLMRKGLAYDSDEGRSFAGALTAILTGVAYKTSAELASKLGAFTHFEFNKKPMMEVMRRHQASLENIVWDNVSENIRTAAFSAWEEAIDLGEKFGYRNAQASVIAPTGTIIYLMDGETTGGEPSLALQYFKNLAGGGRITLVNKEIPNALHNLGYNESQIKDIELFIKKDNSVFGAPHLIPDHYKVFDTSLGNGNGKGSIPFQGHVKMMGAIQPFISGAISKTNNLPENATVKDTYDGFLLGYELGLKGLTIFRDNSKPISALGLEDRSYVKLKRGEKEDLPSSRAAWEWELELGNGTPMHILVSEYEDGRPGQITFLSYKSGSTLGALLTTSGIQISKSLKRGISLDSALAGWLGHEFEPKGFVKGHPFIKSANSPLDLAAKILRLEYLGDVNMANDHDKVDISKLRGAENGAFETYERMKVDDWDFNQVMNDPKTGGFVKSDKIDIPKKGKTELKNKKGTLCTNCGNIMRQTSSNCFMCTNCPNKLGGCGL